VSTWLLIEHRPGGGVDIYVRGRRVLRLTRRPGRSIYGLVTVLHAHADGRSVLKAEIAGNLWARLRTICGVLICIRRPGPLRGSLLVQWRGFGML